MAVTDYHNFTTIDTPQEERDKLYVGEIYINAATCLKCNDYIRSKNKRDYVTCSCGGISVDGGSFYTKRRGDIKLLKDDIVFFNDIKKII